MRDLNRLRTCDILNEIIEAEMAGVVRYAHSSLMVTGPYRQPIVTFLQEQATESLAHALQASVDTLVRALHLLMNHTTTASRLS